MSISVSMEYNGMKQSEIFVCNVNGWFSSVAFCDKSKTGQRTTSYRMTRQLLGKSREKSRPFANVRYILDLDVERKQSSACTVLAVHVQIVVSLSLSLSLGGHRAFRVLFPENTLAGRICLGRVARRTSPTSTWFIGGVTGRSASSSSFCFRCELFARSIIDSHYVWSNWKSQWARWVDFSSPFFSPLFPVCCFEHAPFAFTFAPV